MEKAPIFMNLMTDFAFKRLFGSPERKHILIRFLNILFAEEGMKVEDVVYHDKEVLPEDGSGKKILYDIYCTTPDEREHIVVEMQQLYHPFFENRAVFYALRALMMQARRGADYDFRPVRSIFLVDFHFDHMSRDMVHDIRLMDFHSHEVYSDLFRMLFLHLNEAPPDWDDCRTEYEKIMFIIKNMHKMDKESKAYKSREYPELFEESEIASMVAEDAVAYSNSYRKYLDNMAAVDYAAQKNLEAGIAIGQERGIAIGEERGIAIGEERGIAIGEERGIAIGEERGIAIGEERGRIEGIRLMAQRMRDSGMSDDYIKKITGISLD